MDATAFGQPLVTEHIPKDFVPLEVIVIAKGLDSQSNKTFITWTSTPALDNWEALGMVMFTADGLRAHMRGGACSCDVDEEE